MIELITEIAKGMLDWVVDGIISIITNPGVQALFLCIGAILINAIGYAIVLGLIVGTLKALFGKDE